MDLKFISLHVFQDHCQWLVNTVCGSVLLVFPFCVLLCNYILSLSFFLPKYQIYSHLKKIWFNLTGVIRVSSSLVVYLLPSHILPYLPHFRRRMPATSVTSGSSSSTAWANCATRPDTPSRRLPKISWRCSTAKALQKQVFLSLVRWWVICFSLYFALWDVTSSMPPGKLFLFTNVFYEKCPSRLEMIYLVSLNFTPSGVMLFHQPYVLYSGRRGTEEEEE